MPETSAIRLHSSDNVVIMLNTLEEGAEIAPFGISTHSRIPLGHKAALKAIPAGGEVVKYGQIIGVASQDIAPGEHVHTQNVSMTEFDRDYAFSQHSKPTTLIPDAERATFQGYRRPDGKVGTRNYVGIVTAVNCSASVATMIAREAERSGLLDRYPNVDGVVPIVHGAGCCIGTDDEAFRKLQRTIWGFARHPNFASVLMLGLGCEANQIPLMLEVYGNPPPEQFRYFTLQAQGGTRKSVEQGLVWLEEALGLCQSSKP